MKPDAEFPPIRSKSRSPGPPGTSRSAFKQGTDIQGEDRDIPSPELLKEDSSSTLSKPDFAGLDELSIKPFGQSGNNGDGQVIDTTTAVNRGTTLVEAGHEAEAVDILSEGSSEESKLVQ